MYLQCRRFASPHVFLQHNAINTGNNRKTANLPKAKLDFARLSFYFWGASIFNSLPLGLRNINSGVFI